MNNLFSTRDDCRLCRNENLQKVLSLKPTALCDAYVSGEEKNVNQFTYPLDLFLCNDCGYVHVPYNINPEAIYLDYLYETKSSLGLKEHFNEYSGNVLEKINPSKNSLVVDIGSNDGILLSFFKKNNLKVLGIEPASHIAKEATLLGTETLAEFFTEKFAIQVKEKYGQAAIITINNLFANVDDLEDFAKGLYHLLDANGALIIESSYLKDMMEQMVFDFIYHEHLSYFSVKPLEKFFKRFNMELFDIEQVNTKGGSLRYYFQKKGNNRRPITTIVNKMLEDEKTIGLSKEDIFINFNKRINLKKEELLEILRDLKKKGKSIAAYGASASSTTLIYHFELTRYMEYIVDDNQVKHNTYSPGLHIPVWPSQVLYEKRPDYVVILAWRYAEAIMKKHNEYLETGGHFIVPLPEVYMS